jgi:hypothetical protein
MRPRLLCLALLMLVQLAWAQEDPDLQALQLADQITTKPEAASNWRSYVEGALGGSVLRRGDAFQPEQRGSIDVRYDDTFTPGWRAVFSDRLDAYNPAQVPFNNAINTLREAYLSWQAQPDLLFDLGRINERNGVALGYNPTDYFKTDAVRSAVSVDPNSLKENRQGSVMLRMQKLSDSGSVTLLYSPKLDETPSYADFNPDFAATNNSNRWLLSYSPKFANEFNPKLLMFKSDQMPVQFGLNLTSLVNDATVLYLEWSGGNQLTQLAQAQQLQGIPYEHDAAFRNRISSGLTYTTDNKISLTAELEFNGAGMEQQPWDAIATSPLYGRYRYYLQGIQESPTKRTAFIYGSWQDALINHLDLSAMEKMDLVDSSRLSWLEARYHLSHSEFALQWQLNSGTRFSEFGAVAQTQTWALVGRFYF